MVVHHYFCNHYLQCNHLSICEPASSMNGPHSSSSEQIYNLISGNLISDDCFCLSGLCQKLVKNMVACCRSCDARLAEASFRQSRNIGSANLAEHFDAATCRSHEDAENCIAHPNLVPILEIHFRLTA